MEFSIPASLDYKSAEDTSTLVGQTLFPTHGDEEACKPDRPL